MRGCLRRRLTWPWDPHPRRVGRLLPAARIQSHGAAIICGGKGRAGSGRNGPEAAQKGKQKKRRAPPRENPIPTPVSLAPPSFLVPFHFHLLIAGCFACFVYLLSSLPAAAAEAGEGDARGALDAGQGAPPVEIHQYVHTPFSLVACLVDDPFLSIVDRVQVVKECSSVWLQSRRVLCSF
jgi:hypothetical protein